MLKVEPFDDGRSAVGYPRQGTALERRLSGFSPAILKSAPTALLVAVIALALSTAMAADAAPSSVPKATARTYVVEAGDTLLGIAGELDVPGDQEMDWVDAVVSLNGLDGPDQLTIGESLTLPDSTPAAAASTPTSSTPASAGGTYTVQPGDTLLGIAEVLAVPGDQQMDWVAAVVSLNGLPDADHLTVGQTLTLPGSAPAAPVSKTQTTAAPTVSMPHGGTYTIQEGDENLYDLAERLGVPASQQDDWVNAVVRINNLDAKGLYVGNVIQLPD